MRKSGGQPGHEVQTREMVAPKRINERLVHLPERCGCGHEFDGSEERLGESVVQAREVSPAVDCLRLRQRSHGPWSRS